MPRAGLTRAAIAAAALELIDENGIAAFSMRKLGARLGVDPMAVYRHFRDQEDVFDAVAEAIFDEIETDALPWEEGWRAVAERYSYALRDVLLAHPNAVATFATRPVRSQASIDTGVRMIEVFTAAGFTPGDALRVSRSLRELTIGHALSLATVRLGAQTRSRKPDPGAPDYNVLAEAADATTIDDHFEVGLAAMLDGCDHLHGPPSDLGRDP
ncbi:AcrR family transcriptional regulator [Lipingzhangella halophila]|uniref:AcrR family transcriptional regulator n=1 Tax=Lipingzhangella halophila TaxID=1783352 RepID=A0A7W7RF49_9ACTN|nr:TetR/AcrR family transcriptional regulator C-terminal domain-containing protein [Lipingzhangella halophila]MBB4930774.1 AcrR family transcriptional regulator [Lipingzhangella halophila]